ncbi:MAG TPA: hypothetical protein VGO33_06805 [Gemmatimonadaceae bacterium]|jgi:hypothetical protein|nr:hypothetical protein [Gemmatimonadaceae bacterium]
MNRDDTYSLQHIGAVETAFVIHEPGLHTRVEKRVNAHVAGCEKCSTLLRVHRGQDRRVAELLAALDIPAPATQASGIIARASGQSPAQVAVLNRGGRAAAVIALISIAAVAAAAVPASPLHKLIMRTFASGPSGKPSPTRPVAKTGQSAPPGVFLRPDSSLDIVFLGYNAGLVRVRIVDGLQASLTSASAGSQYRVSNDRILVDQAPQATFDLTLPRSLRVVHIWAGGELTLDRLHRALVGDTGSFTIPLSRAAPVKPSH